jgi:photosystem II stability/assembly factor-like uncharacterized protein
MKLLRLSWLLASLFVFSNASAQNWTEMHKDAEVNFNEIRTSFESYWEGRSIEKGKGYKQFKRWEYFMESRLDEKGALPDGGEIWEAISESSKRTKTSAVADWQHMGPVSVPANGGAGRLNCIAFHPTNASIMWVGAPSGGLWKTTNGGQSWSTNTDWLACIGVSDIVIHPTNPDTMYLATGDFNAGDTYSIGVLKSTDGGNTWNTTGMSYDMSASRKISRMLMHPSDVNILIATTSAGIYRTTNAGDSWTLVRSGSFSDLAFKPDDADIVYAAGSIGFFRSTNGGQSFSVVSGLGSTSTFNRLQLAVTPADANYVYVLASNASTNGFGGLFRSTDAGVTFSQRSTTPNILGWSNNGSDQGGQGWYDLALTASPLNKNIILTGGVNIWKSVTGGSNWTISAHWTGSGAPYVHADIHWLVYSPHNGNTVFACTDGGLFRSTNNGGAWTDLSNGLAISQIYRLGLSVTNPNLVISGWQDNGTNLRATNGVWARVRGGDGMECIIDYSNAAIMYSTTYYGNISRSTNSGISWSSVTDNIQETGAWVTPYVMHPTTPQTLYAGYVNLYRTTNRGNSWSKISNFTGTTTLRSLAVAESNTNVIYMATTSAFYKTLNGGTAWLNLSANLPGGGAITYIAVHPTNPSTVYITRGGFSSGNKVFKSINGGTSWTNITNNLPNIPANCIVYEKGSNDGLYVGTDVGVYYTDNGLTEWIPFNDQLPNVIVKELEIHYGTRMIRAATYGRGVWESHLYSWNTGLSEAEKPARKGLNVYPSPATHQITVEIPGVEPAYTTFRIYTSDGRLVETLHQGSVNKLQIDVAALAAGSYVVEAFHNSTSYRSVFVKK